MFHPSRPIEETPIFSDTNKDGYLDSKEILAALTAEEKDGLKRTPSERAHGVLEIMQLRKINQAFNDAAGQMHAADALTFENFNRLLLEATQAISNQFISALQDYHNNPEAFEANIQQAIAATNAPDDYKQTLRTDLRNFITFAKDFPSRFPEGIRLESHDSAEMLEHFGPIIVPSLPSAPTLKHGTSR